MDNSPEKLDESTDETSKTKDNPMSIPPHLENIFAGFCSSKVHFLVLI